MPLGANGPVRYTSSGMKISFACPETGIGASTGPAATSTASSAIAEARSVMCGSPSLSVRKRPEPELFLGDLPQTRESVRLDDQEQDDEAAEHHELDLLLQRDGHGDMQQVRHVREEDRDQHDEARPEERAEDRAEPADDHHEQHEERQPDVEGQRLGAAEVEEDVLGARHAAVERR